MRKKCNRQEPSLDVIVIASMARQPPKVRAGRDMQGWLAPPLLCGAVDRLARGAEHEFNRLAAEGSRFISKRKGANR
jgi:hypothetical protein